MDSCCRRFPDCHISHHGRRHVQVRGNGSKVERRERKHETFQSTIFHPVQDTCFRIRLVGIYLTGIKSTETKEVDQFARSVDFCLERILALSQHDGCVQYITIFSGKQFCYTQHDGSTFYPRKFRPFLMRLHCCIDSHLHFFLSGLMISGQYMVVIMRHHDFTGIACTDFFTSDNQWYIPFFRRELRKSLFQG